MPRDNTPPSQQAREQSRADHAAHTPDKDAQDFGRREIQRGTQRSETQIEGGRRHDDAGSHAPEPGRPEKEQGDAKRPYKRAGR